jgi:hypothetical protein
METNGCQCGRSWPFKSVISSVALGFPAYRSARPGESVRLELVESGGMEEGIAAVF